MPSQSTQPYSNPMVPRASWFPPGWSLADLQRRLGDVPAHRIRLTPPPGFARVEDVARIEVSENRLYELEAGVLVEKTMGWLESIIAAQILLELGIYLRRHDFGQVLGPDGALEILPGTTKIPDVSFIGWARFAKRGLIPGSIPALVPDLVVEVLSKFNTAVEMESKLATYFQAGVRLVWYIDPATRTAKAWSDPDHAIDVPADGALSGQSVLPGFELALQELFKRAERSSPESHTARGEE